MKKALLTIGLACGLALSSFAEPQQVGRYQIAVGGGEDPTIIKIDTATGEAWTYKPIILSQQSPPIGYHWVRIEED
jgi:hypothetical protein